MYANAPIGLGSLFEVYATILCRNSDGAAINSTPFQLLPGSFRSAPLARAAHEALVQQRRMLYRQTQIPKSQKQVRSISQDSVSFWSIKGNTAESHPAL